MMPFEYQMLGLMTLFFLFAWLPSSVGKMRAFGVAWLNSNRDPVTGRELNPWATRADRAHNNLKDNFPGFAVAIILLGTTGRFDEGTSIAAALYVFVRLAHFVSYTIGLVTPRALFYLVGLGANIYLLCKML
jgi:uncharacterized MAPEG superfamily protein